MNSSIPRYGNWRLPPAIWRLGLVLTLLGLATLVGHLLYDDHTQRQIAQKVLLEEAQTVAPLLAKPHTLPLEPLGQTLSLSPENPVVVIARIELWDMAGQALLWTKTRAGTGNLNGLPGAPGAIAQPHIQEHEKQWFIATVPIPNQKGLLRLIGHRPAGTTWLPSLTVAMTSFVVFPLSWWSIAWMFNRQRLRDEMAVAALLESLTGASAPERNGQHRIGTLIRKLRLRIRHIAHRLDIQQAALTLYRAGPIPERAIAQALEPFLAAGRGHQALVTGGALLLAGHDEIPTLRVAWSSDSHLHSETPIPLLDMSPLEAVQQYEPLQDPDRGQLILSIPLSGKEAPAGFLVLFGHDLLGTVEDEWRRFAQDLGVVVQRWETLCQQKTLQGYVQELFRYSEHPAFLLEERGRILDLNRAAERFLQRGRLETAGNPLFKVLPEAAQEPASQVIRLLQMQRRVEPRPLTEQGTTPWMVSGERIEGSVPLLLVKLHPRHTWANQPP